MGRADYEDQEHNQRWPLEPEVAMPGEQVDRAEECHDRAGPDRAHDQLLLSLLRRSSLAALNVERRPSGTVHYCAIVDVLQPLRPEEIEAQAELVQRCSPYISPTT